MCRYIDAGTTRQHLTDRLMESAFYNVGIKADVDEVFRDIAENRLPVWIDELQTHDVQEVRHGKWVNVNPTVDSVQCSNCGYQFQSTELTTPYCPNCGAKMEGED